MLSWSKGYRRDSAAGRVTRQRGFAGPSNDWRSAARPRRSVATEGLVSCNVRVRQHLGQVWHHHQALAPGSSAEYGAAVQCSARLGAQGHCRTRERSPVGLFELLPVQDRSSSLNVTQEFKRSSESRCQETRRHLKVGRFRVRVPVETACCGYKVESSVLLAPVAFAVTHGTGLIVLSCSPATRHGRA
jgi:hypothetical protein